MFVVNDETILTMINFFVYITGNEKITFNALVRNPLQYDLLTCLNIYAAQDVNLSI